MAAVENHKLLEMFSLSFHVRHSTQQTGIKRGRGHRRSRVAGGCLGSQSVAQACNLRLFNVPTAGTATAAGGAEAGGATWVTGWLPLAEAVAATVCCGWA